MKITRVLLALTIAAALLCGCAVTSFALGYVELSKYVEPDAEIRITVATRTAGWERADIRTVGLEYIRNTGPGNEEQLTLEAGQSATYTYKVTAALGQEVSVTWYNIEEMDPELEELIPGRDLSWEGVVRLPVESDGPYTYDLIGEKEIIITRGPLEAEDGVLEIPGEIDGYTVTEIGEGAFQNQYSDVCNIRKVTIPETVTEIEDDAFLFMETLESVDFPDGLIRIGTRAFSGCSLAELSLPDGLQEIGQDAFASNPISVLRIPASVTSIGFDAFTGCDQLETVIYPETALETGERAFSQCESLSRVELPGSLEVISPGTFGGCTGLRQITLPENLKEVGFEAFAGSGLESVDLPSSVETIGESAFEGCSALAAVRISNGLVRVSDAAFKDCTALETMPDFPDSVQYVEESVFMGCTAMGSARWPASVPVIPDSAFEGCSSLKTIVLPETLTEIRYAAFLGTALETVYYDGSRAQWEEVDVRSDGEDDTNAPLKTAEFIWGIQEPDPVVPDDPADETEIPVPQVIDQFPGGIRPVQDAVARPAIARDAYYVTGYTAGRDPVPAQDVTNAWQLPEEVEAVMYTSYGLPVETGAILRTGETLEFADNDGVVCTALVIIRGDVTGSGVMNLTQLVRLAQAFTGQTVLEGPYAMAADLSGSGKLDLTDLVQASRIFTGKTAS